jgi:hypothetical protein
MHKPPSFFTRPLMYDTSGTSGSGSRRWHEEEDRSGPGPPNNFIGQVAFRDTHLLPIVCWDQIVEAIESQTRGCEPKVTNRGTGEGTMTINIDSNCSQVSHQLAHEDLFIE